MTIPQRPGSIAGGGWPTYDDERPWALVREHRRYCLAVVAIILTTMFGAHWAAQPTGGRAMTSSPSSATVEITDTDAGPTFPAAPAPGPQPER